MLKKVLPLEYLSIILTLSISEGKYVTLQHLYLSLWLVFFLSGRNGLPALSHGFFNSVMLWRAGPQGLVISKRYLEISLTEQTKSAPYTKWCTKCSVACFFQESYLRWKKLVIAMLSMVIYWKFSQVSTGNLSSKTVQNVWKIHCI